MDIPGAFINEILKVGIYDMLKWAGRLDCVLPVLMKTIIFRVYVLWVVWVGECVYTCVSVCVCVSLSVTMCSVCVCLCL